MTRKTLVSTLILTLCTILLIRPETAETQESPTEHNGEAHTHASDYVQRGRQHVAVGDYATAIADFDKALEITPESPAAYYYRASAKFEWGKSEQGTGNTEHAKRLYHAAIEDYTQVITLDPENPRAYIFGGMVHLRLGGVETHVGNRKQAKHHFQAVHKMGRQLTDLDPRNASGWRTRGVASLRLDVLAVDQGNVEQAQRHYDDSIEAYNQAVTLEPENPAVYASRTDVHLYRGILEMTRSDFKQAHHHYQLAIEDASQSTRMVSTMQHALFFSLSVNAAYLKLADAEVALGKTEDAHSHYQLALDSLGAMTFLGQGTIAAEGAYAYLAAGKLKLGASEALLGNIEQAEQHYRAAIADCDQLLALVPRKVKAFYTRGRAKAALGDYTGAIADFARVVTLKPDHALAYYAQGLAKQALGQDDAAEFDFAKARVLSPYVDKLYPFSIGGEE